LLISSYNGLLAAGELSDVEPVFFEQDQSVRCVEDTGSWEVEVLVELVSVVEEVEVGEEAAGSCTEDEELAESGRKDNLGYGCEGGVLHFEYLCEDSSIVHKHVDKGGGR